MRSGECTVESLEWSIDLTMADTSMLPEMRGKKSQIQLAECFIFWCLSIFLFDGKMAFPLPQLQSSQDHRGFWILQLNEQSCQLYPDQYFALFWKIETMHYNTHGWYLLTNVSSQSYQSAILYHPLLEVEKSQKDCCQLTGILLALCAYIAKKYTITNLIESLFGCCSECHYHGIAYCTHLHKCKIINTTISMQGIIDVWGYLWLKCC